jgi:hypothetical protein
MNSSIALRIVGVSLAVSGILVTRLAAAADSPPSQTPPTAAPQAPPTGEAPLVAEEPGNHPAPNSIYLEGLGAGLLYSINYERMVIDDVGVRIGFSYTSFGASATSANGQASSASASVITIPVTASYIGIRGRKSSLELGGGATILYASGSASAVGASSSGAGMAPLGLVMVGYRLHPVDQAGFQLRVGLMALIGEGLGFSSDATKIGVLPWGYLSLGASF